MKTTYEIHQKNNNNWDIIPEGEFSSLKKAEKAKKELEKKLGWTLLKIVEVQA